MRQVYQCWWRIFREIDVSSMSEYQIFYILYPFVNSLLTPPLILGILSDLLIYNYKIWNYRRIFNVV
jgi:hypothetical protein